MESINQNAVYADYRWYKVTFKSVREGKQPFDNYENYQDWLVRDMQEEFIRPITDLYEFEEIENYMQFYNSFNRGTEMTLVKNKIKFEKKVIIIKINNSDDNYIIGGRTCDVLQYQNIYDREAYKELESIDLINSSLFNSKQLQIFYAKCNLNIIVNANLQSV